MISQLLIYSSGSDIKRVNRHSIAKNEAKCTLKSILEYKVLYSTLKLHIDVQLKVIGLNWKNTKKILCRYLCIFSDV